MKHALLSAMMLLSFACSKNDFGLPAESQQFSAGVKYNNKVDILFMVDNSSSMLKYQNKFSSEVPAMISALNSTGLDYHIAITNSDIRSGAGGGKFVGSPKYFSNGTPNLVSSLQARLLQGQAGNDLEQGLDSVYRALQPSYLSGEGAGFLRDDALLAIVILTNEDDYSSVSTTTVRNYFDSLKRPFAADTKSWMMNFIGVTSISGSCSTAAEFKEAGLRYMEIADYTGGIKESICDSTLSTAVSNMRKRIVEVMSEYRLDRVPVLSSIKVTKNGETVPKDDVNGWSYYAPSNSVRFHGTYQPTAYDTVNVNYAPAEGT